jgi:hypothetical protein
MIYAIIKLYNKIESGFMTYPLLCSKTFCPDSEILFAINLEKGGKGRTYKEKKNFLRDQAIAYQSCYEYIDDLLAIVEISNYFEHWGRKYGLLREFKENGII